MKSHPHVSQNRLSDDASMRVGYPVAASCLTARFSEALEYARVAHADQVRKGSGVPYLSHPIAVAALVLEHGGDEEQAIAALLHDVIEDCGCHHEAVIAERFGAGVARLVRGCTDSDVQPKPPWRPRKEAYIAALRHKDDRILLVSACDKLHNLRCILWDLRDAQVGPRVFDRFSASTAETLWYYRELAQVYDDRDCPVSPKVTHTVARIEEALHDNRSA